jgi:hypothetical protein
MVFRPTLNAFATDRREAPRWAAEVGLVVRDLVDQTRADEAFVRRVLA